MLQKLLEAQYEDKKITGPTMADQRKLLDDFAEHADILAIAVFVLGATNILLNSLLLIGSCCRVRWDGSPCPHVHCSVHMSPSPSVPAPPCRCVPMSP